MGFADLSITDIAAEYDLTVQAVFDLCDQLGIAYKNQDTNLALEDAKAVIMQILHRAQAGSNPSSWLSCNLLIPCPLMPLSSILIYQKPLIVLVCLIKTLFF